MFHIKRHYFYDAWLCSVSGACLGSGWFISFLYRFAVHSRQIAHPTVRMIGPINSPTMPNASKPPSMPNSINKKGIGVTLLIKIGLSTLSSWLTAPAPQIHMPIASAVLPCINNQTPAKPQAMGVQNGISASMAVMMPNRTGDGSPATQ